MNRSLLFAFLLSGAICLVAGCSSTDDNTVNRGLRESATGRLLTGELNIEDYPDELRRQNIEARRDERLDVNSDETRAWNLRTKRFEYLPQDVEFKRWNAQEERWEFMPLRNEEDSYEAIQKEEKAPAP